MKKTLYALSALYLLLGSLLVINSMGSYLYWNAHSGRHGRWVENVAPEIWALTVVMGLFFVGLGMLMSVGGFFGNPARREYYRRRRIIRLACSGATALITMPMMLILGGQMRSLDKELGGQLSAMMRLAQQNNAMRGGMKLSGAVCLIAGGVFLGLMYTFYRAARTPEPEVLQQQWMFSAIGAIAGVMAFVAQITRVRDDIFEPTAVDLIILILLVLIPLGGCAVTLYFRGQTRQQASDAEEIAYCRRVYGSDEDEENDYPDNEPGRIVYSTSPRVPDNYRDDYRSNY